MKEKPKPIIGIKDLLSEVPDYEIAQIVEDERDFHAILRDGTPEVTGLKQWPDQEVNKVLEFIKNLKIKGGDSDDIS